MKTKIIFSMLGIMLATYCGAQEIATFRVDDTYYSVVESPNEYQFEEYSTSQGGKLMATKKVAANTITKLQYAYKNRPAFYLHHKTIDYPQGDNTVIHLPQEEFILANVRLVRDAGGTYIKWKATVHDNVHFALYKTITNGSLIFIEKVKPTAQGTEHEYVSSLQEGISGTYVLKVVKNEKQERHELLIGNLSLEPQIKVYPTVSHGIIKVDLDDMDFARYAVFNMNGQKITEGTFNATITNLQLSTLTDGSYFITIWNEQFEETKKMTIKN